MSKKQKMWLGIAAILILNTAFIVEDFTGSFRYWNWVYGLVILVVLAALLTGCFRWYLTGRKNTKSRDKSFNKNFWMLNKKQLICFICLITTITIIAVVRCWQTKVHIYPLTAPFMIGTLIVITSVYIVCVRLFRDKESEEPKDEQGNK
jgi:membrane protein implicated in regulation of membrane protease activity